MGAWTLQASVAYSWLRINSLLCLMHASNVRPLCARVPSVPDNALQVGGFGRYLSVIQWFSTVLSKAVCMCLCAHQGQWVESCYLQLFHSLLFASSLSVSVFIAQCAVLLCSLSFWPPFVICFSSSILVFFSCSLSLPLCFHLPWFLSPSPPLFICCPVYSLPLSSLLSFLSFCLLCFSDLLLSELSTWWADRDTDTHGGTHILHVETQSFIDKHTHSQTLKTGHRGDSQLYTPTHTYTHTQTLSYCVALGRGLFSGWVTLYSVYFPPSVVKQQPSEAKTMATASAALTMGSRPHDISLGATHRQTDTNRHDTHTHKHHGNCNFVHNYGLTSPLNLSETPLTWLVSVLIFMWQNPILYVDFVSTCYSEDT